MSISIVKKSICLVGLLLVSNVSASNWTLIAKSSAGAKYYIDTSTVFYISKFNRVSFNVKVNEPKRDSQGNISYLENRLVNCKDGIHILIFVQAYDRLDLQGRETNREYLDKPTPFIIQPGTVGGELALAACKLAR